MIHRPPEPRRIEQTCGCEIIVYRDGSDPDLIYCDLHKLVDQLTDASFRRLVAIAAQRGVTDARVLAEFVEAALEPSEVAAAPVRVTVHESPCPVGWVWLSPVKHTEPSVIDLSPVLVRAAHVTLIRSASYGSIVHTTGGHVEITSLEPIAVAKLVADALEAAQS